MTTCFMVEAGLTTDPMPVRVPLLAFKGHAVEAMAIHVVVSCSEPFRIVCSKNKGGNAAFEGAMDSEADPLTFIQPGSCGDNVMVSHVFKPGSAEVSIGGIEDFVFGCICVISNDKEKTCSMAVHYFPKC